MRKLFRTSPPRWNAERRGKQIHRLNIRLSAAIIRCRDGVGREIAVPILDRYDVREASGTGLSARPPIAETLPAHENDRLPRFFHSRFSGGPADLVRDDPVLLGRAEIAEPTMGKRNPSVRGRRQEVPAAARRHPVYRIVRYPHVEDAGRRTFPNTK